MITELLAFLVTMAIDPKLLVFVRESKESENQMIFIDNPLLSTEVIEWLNTSSI